MSQVQPLPVHWVHRALAMRGKSVQKRAVFSCFETFSLLFPHSVVAVESVETTLRLETSWDFLHLFVEAGFVRVLFVARLMHLLHLARRLRFRLELTRVKRCVITLGSLTTVQPRQSRGQGGWTAWTRVLHIQNKLQVVQMVGCKQHNSSYEHIFLHYRCTILLDALGPLDAPRYSNHCKRQHDTRVWTQRLCAGVFVVYAFVHHFCKQNGVDARLDSKHSPGQAECWKPRESVKSYRCSKKIHSRKRISLQLPTYEIDLNWLLSDLLIYQSASYILVYEIQNMIYCMYIYIYSTDSTWISPFSQPNLHASSLPTERSVTWWILMIIWWFIARRHLQADPIRCTWHSLVKSPFDANISLRTYGIHMGPHMSYFAYLSHVWFSTCAKMRGKHRPE